MLSPGLKDSGAPSPSTSKSKKPRKKKLGGKNKQPEDPSKVNGVKEEEDDHGEDEQDVEDDNHDDDGPMESARQSTHSRKSSRAANGVQDASKTLEQLKMKDSGPSEVGPANGVSPISEAVLEHPEPASNEATEARLDALARDRSALRDEVAQLRKSLEELQEKHAEELGSLRSELEETQSEKEHTESQYHNLLGRVNTIKSQLGERLKSDAEELAQARSRIEELEEANAELRTHNEARTAEVGQLGEEREERSKELSTLRNRLNLSQQNWNKEREDLIKREAFAREEFDSARQAMQDWEVLAMEERSIRENLGEKVAELEEQVTGMREMNQSLESERSTQALNIDGLQRALRELQDARKQELREIVENSQSQAKDLQNRLQEAQDTASRATKDLDSLQKELERLSPMENEVKEKNLLIGKLRHEAVVLNEHLIKALKQVKRGKADDTIDRQLVTNHLLHFIQLDRSDPKKFQVLQIMASLLNWTDEQREKAGLSRPGASNPSLRTPISPWHRTPSTPSLHTDFLSPQPTPQTGVSLGGLWNEFLEKEATSGGRGSRSTSVSSRQGTGL